MLDVLELESYGPDGQDRMTFYNHVINYKFFLQHSIGKPIKKYKFCSSWLYIFFIVQIVESRSCTLISFLVLSVIWKNVQLRHSRKSIRRKERLLSKLSWTSAQLLNPGPSVFSIICYAINGLSYQLYFFFVCSVYLDLSMVNYSYFPYFQHIEINVEATVENKDEVNDKVVESAGMEESTDARHGLHLPVFDIRGRCKYSGCNGKSSLRCSSCGIHLCLSKTRNCFFLFHSAMRNEWRDQLDCFCSSLRI